MSLVLFARTLSLVQSVCHLSCLTCLSLNEWDCLTCVPGLYLQPYSIGLCLDYCPTGFLPNSGTWVCDGSAQEVIVDYVLDRIAGAIPDKYRGWTAQNGSTAAYYPPAFEASDPLPMKNRGYHFDGNQHVMMPPYPGSVDPTPLVGTETSVLAWIRPEARQSMTIVALNVNTSLPPGENALVFKVQAAGALTLVSHYMRFDGVTVLALGQWYCVSVTTTAYNSPTSGSMFTTGKLYINGNLDVTTDIAGWVFTEAAGIGCIGQDYDPGAGGTMVMSEFFVGFIYQVKLFNYAIAQSQVASEIAALQTPASASYALSSCVANEYFDTTGGCLACSTSCTTGCVRGTDCSLCADLLCKYCSSFDLTGCTECKANASGGVLGCSCDAGYYFDRLSASCQLCNSGCLTCSGGLTSDCMSCKANAQLATILTPTSCVCFSGFVGSPDSCQACDPTCGSCSGTAGNQCLACKANAGLDASGTCKCSSSSYGSPDSSNCLSCSSTCLTCVGGADSQCSSCKSYAKLDSVGVGNCVCAGAYYPAPTSAACASCDLTCGSCSGASGAVCLSCYANAHLDAPLTGHCVCNAGFFPAPISSVCKACSTTCASCLSLGASFCTGCRSNASLDAVGVGNCVCDSGYYAYPSSANCQQCDFTCAECVGSGIGSCKSCLANASLDAVGFGHCVCNPGCYGNPDARNCMKCDSTCLTCSGGSANQCFSCFPDADLAVVGVTVTQTCVCNPGFAGNPTSRNCSPCALSCSTCFGLAPSQCQTCHSHATLASGSCVCDPGWFENAITGNCEVCEVACSQCSGPKNNDCLACVGPADLLSSPGSCQCREGYARDATGLCVSCHLSCRSCSGPAANECLTCFDNSEKTTSSECFCLPSFYLVPGTATCGRCHSTCMSCSGPDRTNCATCHAHAFLSSGSCACDTGYWPNPSSADCSLCDQSCSTCIGGSKSDCVSCPHGFELAAGQCVCPIGHFQLRNPDECVACSSGCEMCTSNLLCLQCVSGKFLHTSGMCSELCELPNTNKCDKFNDPAKCFSANLTESALGLVLTFSTILNQPLRPEDISLTFSISGKQPVEEDWRLAVLTPNLTYELTLSKDTVPNNTTASLAFLTPLSIASSECLGLATSKLTLQLNSTVDVSPQDSALITAGQTPVATVITSLVVVSILSGGSGFLWMFIHNIQLISYIPLSNIPLPDSLRSVLVSSNPIDLLPNLFDFLPKAGEETEIPSHVQNEHIYTFSFLRNIGEAITSFCICLAISSLYFLFQFFPLRLVRRWAGHKATAKLLSDCPRIWVETYLILCVGAALQVYEISVQRDYPASAFQMSSAVAAFVCGVFLVATLAFVHPWVLQRYQSSKAGEHPLFEDFHTATSMPTRCYYIVFCLRRLLFAFTQVFLPHFPHLQGVMNLTHCFWVLLTQFSVYTCLFLRFKQRIMKFVSVVAELGITFVFVLSELFFLDISEGQKHLLEMIVVCTVVLVSAVHFAGIGYLMGLQVCAMVREARAGWRTNAVKAVDKVA